MGQLLRVLHFSVGPAFTYLQEPLFEFELDS
jgi:hypothetical protein